MKTNDYVDYFESAIVFICAIILFGWYRRLSKPTFVWVMWTLFIVAEVANLIASLILRQINEASE